MIADEQQEWGGKYIYESKQSSNNSRGRFYASRLFACLL